MKKTIKLMTNIASFVLGIPFILVVLSLWYDGYTDKTTYPDFYNNIHKDRPSLEEVSTLLADTTQDFPFQSDISEHEKSVLVSVITYYDKPTDDLFTSLLKDIEKKQVWVQTESYSTNKMTFCHGQYELEINKDVNDKGVEYLSIDVGWYAHGQCRRQYYNLPKERLSVLEFF